MVMAKSKRKARQKNLDRHHNQMRLNRVLAVLGVTDLHKTLHGTFREFIVNNPGGPLILERPTDLECKFLLKRLGEWQALTYKGISASDFIEVMFPLIRQIGSAVGKGLMAEHENRQFKEVTEELFSRYATPAGEFLNYFTERLVGVMQLAAWEGTDLDRQYLKTEFEVDNPRENRFRCKIVVSVEPVRRAWVWGGWKHQIGTYYDKSFNPLPQMRWLSKCPLDYGLPGEESENLPVYISDHALTRIQERLDVDWVRASTLFDVYFSMDNSVCHPLNDGSGDMLVEVRMHEMKLGYFVVSRTRTEIIIKTFLFITMYQTPEGYKLHRRLRMARPDYDFHKLDNYSTLARSDLTTHPKLRPIWEDCGFDGLLKLIDRGIQVIGRQQKKQADDLIKYFRLEEAS